MWCLYDFIYFIHFKSVISWWDVTESTLNRNTIRKNQETNTPNVMQICQLTPKSKLDPSRLNPPSISLNIYLNDLSRMFRNSVNLRGQFLRMFLRNSVIFLTPKTDFRNWFYTEFSQVINGLGIYLIDYRECVFTALMQYPQLIY